ncbi:hypothetical protein [Sphingobium sp.]|nr:hypothetical protein [Sphingobium sp.]
MSLPAIIHSEIDPAAITKVTRLFNNTLGDVLALCGITGHAFS